MSYIPGYCKLQAGIYSRTKREERAEFIKFELYSKLFPHAFFIATLHENKIPLSPKHRPALTLRIRSLLFHQSLLRFSARLACCLSHKQHTMLLSNTTYIHAKQRFTDIRKRKNVCLSVFYKEKS